MLVLRPVAGALLAAALFSACGPESGELSPSSEEDEAGSGGKADGIFPFDRAPRPGTGGPSRASAAKILERALAPGESLQNVNVLWDPSAGALLEGVALAANRASYRYLSLDQQGTKRTYASWRSAADMARFARFGKLHPDVFQAASAGSTVEVLVIAVEPEGLSSRIPPNTSADKVKPFVAGNNRRIKMLWAPRLKAVSAWLTGRRAVVTAQAEQLGAVQAKVPSAVLLGRELQANADILAVVPVGGPPQRLMYQGFQSLGGPLESPLCAGIAPAPANQCMGFFPIREAALFEGSFYPTRLNPLNPYLHANASREVVYHLSGPEQLQACTRSADCSGGFDRATFACVQGQCVDVHATWVAGVIGAWGDYEGATYQGVAHYRPYVSHVQGPLAVDWAVKDCDGAIQNGVCRGNQLDLLFGNSSTGYAEMRDPRSGWATLVNRAARYSYFLMAQAAGNDGDGAESYCGGLINAVCVGAYGFTSPTDRSTFGTTGEASTRNPASAPDRELPHVVGPGAGVRALNARYGIEGGVMESAQVHGTSFATPRCSPPACWRGRSHRSSASTPIRSRGRQCSCRAGRRRATVSRCRSASSPIRGTARARPI